ncbi:MAG: DUF2780 domain-containing protein [Cyanobacteria bacterium P01_A01_bin.68]
MELVQQLVSNLGVQEDQAKGGAGLILKLAQDKLGGEEFAKVASAIPGSDVLLGSAPSQDGGGGMMGALGGMAAGMMGGGQGAALGNLMSLAGGFSQLGMDGNMVTKFFPIVLNFVQQKGGADIAGILSKALQ